MARPWLWDRLPAAARFVSADTRPPLTGLYPPEQHLRHFPIIDEPDALGLDGLANERRDVSWLYAAAMV